MPPKPKFKKREIVAAVREIVSEKVIESLTAQELRNSSTMCLNNDEN